MRKMERSICLTRGRLLSRLSNSRELITVRLTSETVEFMKKNEKSVNKLWQDLKNNGGV